MYEPASRLFSWLGLHFSPKRGDEARYGLAEGTFYVEQASFVGRSLGRPVRRERRETKKFTSEERWAIIIEGACEALFTNVVVRRF